MLSRGERSALKNWEENRSESHADCRGEQAAIKLEITLSCLFKVEER